MASTPFDLMTATQPQATSALAAPQYNPEGLTRLGAKLSTRFTTYETDRRPAELKWARNARQFLGIYDPEVERSIPANRSKAYPKLTRIKCVSMLSRLMNLLFQAGDQNWDVTPSAVPNLAPEDVKEVLDSLNAQAAQTQQTQQAGMPPAAPRFSDEQIETAIRQFATKRAGRLRLEIQDQLQELGGTRTEGYVALCRKVLASGIQYGAGVLKGPFVEEQEQRRWTQDASGQLMVQTSTAYRPRFEFVPLWDYYPDMSAKTLAQMEGQFQRVVLSRHQLASLRSRPDFIEGQIDEVLRVFPTGNYRRRTHETELRAEGVQYNATDVGRNKYEAVIWDGFVSGRELAECGIEVKPDQMEADIKAQVWVVGNVVVKAQLDPWISLEVSGEMKQYHHFIFEDDETFLLGNGLPNIMRDSQMGVCASTRMMLDNGSVQRIFEVKMSLMSANQDLSSIVNDKVFFRDDDNPSTLNTPAIVPVELPLAMDKYKLLVDMFQDFADKETFVSAATGGDMQKGPSEPFRTAAGASMLRGDAALPFKDVVRNYDMFTESVIMAIINFNRNFNANPALRGDFQPIARGATSLIAKEVLGIQLDNLAVTLSDGEKPYINMRELARQRIKVRDLGDAGVVYDDAKCDEIDASNAEAAKAQTEQQNRMVEAQVREVLSQVMKNLAQAEKNTAGAEATKVKALLDAAQTALSQPGSGGQQPNQGQTT